MRTLRSSLATSLAGGLLAALALLPTPVAAQSSQEPATSRWALENGMRVVVQNVPRAAGVAVTIGYALGSDRDPAGMEGLAALLAEVAFTSPAGEIAQRSRQDMAGIRPLGWSVKVTPQQTLLTEVVAAPHLPGALYEVSLRIRDLSVTRKSLHDAIGTVTADQRARHGGDVAWTLRQGVRDAALGVAPGASPADPSGIARLTPDEVRARIAALLVPSNLVLSIAGPLGDLALKKLIDDVFGSLPAGTRLDSVAPAPLQAGSASVPVTGIDRAYGSMGIIAPALDNPSHPEFYLHAVLIGAVCSTLWGNPGPPLGAWFEYSLLDEPGLLRLYPPLPPTAHDPADIEGALGEVMRGLFPSAVPPRHLQSVKDGVMWLAGGPLPADLARKVGSTPGIIQQVGASLAARELLGGDAFWYAYRERLSRVQMDLRAWRKYFELPEHQVRVIAVPASRTAKRP